MKAFYSQQADKLYPIYGVSTFAEAQRYAIKASIIETDEKVFMNICTGSVDFESGWHDADIDDGSLVEVIFNSDSEQWETI
jgi:hypothetical protein